MSKRDERVEEGPMSRFKALLDDYREAIEACIQNDIHNTDCRADERIEEETISGQHRLELEHRTDILTAFSQLQHALDSAKGEVENLSRKNSTFVDEIVALKKEVERLKRAVPQMPLYIRPK